VHLDGIIILNNTTNETSIIDGMKIYRNTFGRHVGTRTTAAIFNSLQNPQMQSRNWYIHNNLFLCDPPGHWGNGFITGMGSNFWVFNNSMIGTITNGTGYGGGFYFGGTNAHAYNNIVWSGAGYSVMASTRDSVAQSSTGSATEAVLTNYFKGNWADYNIIVGSAPSFSVLLASQADNNNQWISGSIQGLADWKTWYSNNRGMTVPIWNTAHADPHGKTNAPVFDSGTYVPASTDTAARGAGTNLTELLPDTEMLVDYNGNARPSTGNWTIGAFEYDDGGTAPTITSSAPAAGSVGVPYSHTMTATGDAPITYSVTSGALPTGLALSSAGVISGAPTVVGTYTGVITASNGVAPNATQSFSIVIGHSGTSTVTNLYIGTLQTL
jgi:hypothetical protein